MATALIIGDSHVDTFPLATELKRLLSAKGYTVTVAGVGGSSAKQWLTQNPVCRPNRDWCVDVNTLPQRPDLLLVSLGTNDAAIMALSKGQPEPRSSRTCRSSSHAFRRRLPPPWLGDKVGIATYTAKIYDAAERAGVSIFDSRPSTRGPVEGGSGDGVHLGAAGAKIWAAAIMQATEKAFPWLPVLVVAAAAATATAVYILMRPGRKRLRR